MKSPYLSLVIPVLNEEENLSILAAEIGQALKPCPWSYEVLFVDDGSTDRSVNVMCGLALEDSRFRVLQLERHGGQSAAMGAGFRSARGEAIVTLDADLQNDPQDIPRLVAKLEDWDLVCGVRVERQDPWLRRISSRIANQVRDWVIRDSISDVGCSLKACRAEFLAQVPVFDGMHRFLPALVGMEGARVTEISVRHRPRRHGEPKYNIRNRLWRGLVDLAGVHWLKKRWIRGGQVHEVTHREPHPGILRPTPEPDTFPVSSTRATG